MVGSDWRTISSGRACSATMVEESAETGTTSWSPSVQLDEVIVLKAMTEKKGTTHVKGNMASSSIACAGIETHVSVSSQSIALFMESDKSKMICFRCGQTGHVRYQCLTYKVRLCWHFANATCTDPNCSFAHGEAELRTPWKQRCVRVVKQGGQLVCIGCNSTEHTFRKCPMHQDLCFL